MDLSISTITMAFLLNFGGKILLDFMHLIKTTVGWMMVVLGIYLMIV